jgi:Zn-dependent protease with chaperone function
MTQNKPTILYKLKLFLLALLGYCCIFLMPAIFLAVLGVLFWSIITGKGLYGPLIFFEIVLLILAGKFVQELRAKVRWLFNQFFRRYWNYFRHYSLAFARTREYEADRLAAELTTAEVTADALIRLNTAWRSSISIGPTLRKCFQLKFRQTSRTLPRARKNPRQLYVLVLDHRNRRVGKMIRNISNSLIYRRASNSYLPRTAY